jgi:hypothetical protein
MESNPIDNKHQNNDRQKLNQFSDVGLCSPAAEKIA